MRKLLLGVVVLSSLSVFATTEAEAGWRCPCTPRPGCRQLLRDRRDRCRPVYGEPARAATLKEEVDFLRDRVGDLEGDIEKLQGEVDALK
ncbi:MAG: hypothetical protein HQ567_01360 [Candidatus Nealsonbacteria bacterium]|nr:hypothetical protein [Candidatus Nealsonbacteria bacterium]